MTYQPITPLRPGAGALADGVDVSEVLLREGHALPYIPGQKAKAERLVKWCPIGK